METQANISIIKMSDIINGKVRNIFFQNDLIHLMFISILYPFVNVYCFQFKKKSQIGTLIFTSSNRSL